MLQFIYTGMIMDDVSKEVLQQLDILRQSQQLNFDKSSGDWRTRTSIHISNEKELLKWTGEI